MGDAYRGLTIRIGADTTALTGAIRGLKTAARSAKSDVRKLDQSLKTSPNNLTLLNAKMQALGDSSRASAMQMKLVRTSLLDMSRASGKSITQLVKGTEGAAVKAELLKNSYNSVNRQLQTVYDKMKRIAAGGNTDVNSEAWKEAEKRINAARLSTESLNAEMRELFKDKRYKLPLDAKSIDDLIAKVGKLRSAHKEFDAEMKTAYEQVGIKNAANDMAVFAAETRAANLRAAELKGTMLEIGSKHTRAAYTEMERLAHVATQVDARLERASHALEMNPTSLEAARNKFNVLKASIRTTEQQLKAADRRLKSLDGSKLADVLGKFKSIENAVDKTNRNFAEAKSQVDRYASAIALAEQKMRLLESMDQAGGDEYQRAARQVEKFTGKLSKAEEKLKVVEAEMKGVRESKAFADTAEEVQMLKAKLDGLNGQLGVSKQRLNNLGASLKNMGYGIYSTITPAIMMGFHYMIQSAEDIDSAYRDMRKTVNGTEQEFEHLRDAAIEYSRTHVTSADTILEIEAMGGQLGIAAKDLEEFSTVVSNLDIATNMDSDDIAEMLGKIGGVMDLDTSDYEKFGDALVRLGNNMPVMENDIMTITTRYMGMGKVVGMSADQMLGWAAAASATGQKSEAAGSAMQRFISNAESAVAAGGDKLKAWADVANMSASDFKKAFEDDASGAMYKFIEGLGKIQTEGGSVNQTLKDLGMNNVRDKQLLEGLAQQMANGSKKSNILANALEMSSDAYKGLATTMSDGSIEVGGDALREANKKSQGFSGQLAMLKNNAAALADEAAKGLVPWMKVLTTSFQGLTKFVKQMPDGLKSGIELMTALIGASGPVLVATGTVMTSISNIRNMMQNSQSAWNVVRGASGEFLSLEQSVTRTTSTFGKFMGVAAGIAVVATTAKLLYDVYKQGEERAENLRIATEGLMDVQDGLPSAFDETSASLGDGTANMNQLIDATADMKRGWDEAWDSLQGNASKAEYYKNVILELADGSKLTAEEQAELRNAVAGYNEATGEAITITDAENGTLSVSTKELEKNTKQWYANARAKQYAQQAQEITSKIIEQEENLRKLKQEEAEAEKNWQAYVESYGSEEAARNGDADARAAYGSYEQKKQAVEQAEAAIRSLKAAEEEYLADSTLGQRGQQVLSWANTQGTLSKAIEDSGLSMGKFSKSVVKAGFDVDNLNDSNAAMFARLVQGADGDMAKVQAGLNAINSLEMHGKHVTVDDDGTVRDEKRRIIDLDKYKIKTKKAKVEVDGKKATQDVTTVTGKAKDLAKLDPKLLIKGDNKDAKDKISAVQDKLKGLKNKTVTIEVVTKSTKKSSSTSVDLKEGGNARGGWFAQYHANGGYFVNTPTVVGRNKDTVHIAGEAGREYVYHAGGYTGIIPVQNQHYLRPFAMAVASQMRNVGGSTVNLTVNLAYDSTAEARQMAQDVADHLNAALRMRG